MNSVEQRYEQLMRESRNKRFQWKPSATDTLLVLGCLLSGFLVYYFVVNYTPKPVEQRINDACAKHAGVRQVTNRGNVICADGKYVVIR